MKIFLEFNKFLLRLNLLNFFLDIIFGVLVTV